MSADTPSNATQVEPEHLRQWHRAFGIALMDVFAEAPWRVELGQELALKSQLLDIRLLMRDDADTDCFKGRVYGNCWRSVMIGG